MIATVYLSRVVGIGLAASALVVSCPAWSDILKGMVKDAGAPSKGIAGVKLSVRDAGNKELERGVTNDLGEYLVSYPRQESGVHVFYEKFGFQPRPMKRQVQEGKSPQEPVLLFREGEDEAYYHSAAQTLENLAKKASAETLRDSVAAVAALPAQDKAKVLASLKSFPAEGIVKEINAAEGDAVIVTNVKAAISSEPSLKESDIHVETFNGVVQLSGWVRSNEAKTTAVQVASKVKGVQSVRTGMVSK